MPQSFLVGSVQCHLLSDGLFLADAGACFGVVPKILWEKYVQANNKNQIKLQSYCLLVETEGKLVLVDTGHGDKLSEKLNRIIGIENKKNRLKDDLASVGYTPADIDIVLLTHLHLDHAGGATCFDENKNVVPTFPNAQYICHEKELYAAQNPNERTKATYLSENWQVLLDNKMLQVVNSNKRISKHVYTECAKGHVEALQMLHVEDEHNQKKHKALFLGDTCSFALQLQKLAWVPAFDLFPMDSIKTKKTIVEQSEENTLFIFQHDSTTAFKTKKEIV